MGAPPMNPILRRSLCAASVLIGSTTLLAQEPEASRDQQVRARLDTVLADLLKVYREQLRNKKSGSEIHAALQSRIQSLNKEMRNPLDPTVPAIRPELVVWKDAAPTPSLVESQAKHEIVEPGQISIVLSPKTLHVKHGLLAAATITVGPSFRADRAGLALIRLSQKSSVEVEGVSKLAASVPTPD